jgi:poly(hydroxyalkanoate) depolymerase family esterase
VAVPVAVIAFALPATASALTSTLTGPVQGWSSGNVPSYISMYEYVPAKLAASPPVLVAAHFCSGSASQMFGFTGMPAIEAAADQFGFVMIFPQTTNPATSADCWDVGSTKSLTHNGGGDTQAIAEMVQYEITKRSANPDRVYAMGASSGAMLTEALMAVYPDVFKAGAEFSGVPAGCWTDGWTAQTNWGGTCANGQDMMTAAAWGNLVRGMFPGYTGYRPRLQLWHGTADMTVNFNNQGQAILEWTNVLGLNQTPNSTDTTSTAGFTIEKWQNSCGFTVLEAHTQAGGGHTTPIDSNSVIDFFGLNQPTGPDPEIAACGDAGTSSGNSSSTSTGGATSTGSRSSSGGATGSGGSGSATTGAGGGGSTGAASGSAGTGTGAGSGASGSANGGANHSGSSTGNSANGGSEGETGSGPSNSGGCAAAVPAGSGPAGAGFALVAGVMGIVIGRRRRRG